MIRSLLVFGLLILSGEVGESAAAALDRGHMQIDDNFQTLDAAQAIQGFRAYGGAWHVADGVLHAPAGPGPKLVADELALACGEVGVEVLLPDAAAGNAGLIVKLSDPGVGADRFNGYEVALDAAGYLRLGRHRQNFEPIRDVPCAVPVNRWIALVVRLTETSLAIAVDGRTVLEYLDREHPLARGGVAFRPWQRRAQYRNFWIAVDGQRRAIPLEPAGGSSDVCAPWTPACRDSAHGEFRLVDGPDAKRRAQQIAFLAGDGEVGIEHAGREGQGLLWLAGRRYQGWLWVCAERPATLRVAARTAAGQTLASAELAVAGGDCWQMLPFSLVPGGAADTEGRSAVGARGALRGRPAVGARGPQEGRFAVELVAPGSVRLARVLLQPGDWAWPQTLAAESLPPIAVVVRHPLSAPPAVGQDLWAAQPRGPGCSVRILDPADAGRARTIFDDPAGCIYDMNVSYDARTLFFSYRRQGETHWHIWRIGVDGSGLQQLTDGSYHDVSPCQLPDGDLVFVSTRRFGYTFCQPGPASNLYRMTADGGDVRCVSMNTLSDLSPQMLPDGRVLFTRWEYIDRDLTFRQSLWTQYPDGTQYTLYFGNTIRDVGTFWQARPLPGRNDRLVATFAPHHGFPHGAIGLIDRCDGPEGGAGRGFINLTREFPVIGDRRHEWAYRDPFPLSDRHFLCAYGGGGLERYRICLLDADDNRRLIYEDPQQSCYFPLPLRPVSVPPLLPERVEPVPQPPQSGDENPLGVVLLADVYQGLEPTIRRGQVKSLRVMEQTRKTEDLAARAYDQSPVMSYATYYAKRQWGTVPVEEDGSAHFFVPALREIYFQALDDQGRELQRMTSAVQLMPGERLSCVGCHESRQTAPLAAARLPLAARRSPRQLERPAWNRDGIVDFPSVVQPVLDKYCVECHHGGDPAGGYDLSGDKTRFFNMAYDNLLGRSRSYRQHDMAQGGMLADEQARGKPLVHFYWLLRTPTAVNQPLWTGSHASRLLEYLEGDHGGRQVAAEDRQRIYLWIDANVPYYGTYAHSRPLSPGKRDLASDVATGQPAAWFARDFLDVYQRRCADCHGAYPDPNDHAAIWDGRLAWINFSHPDWSPALTAHLAAAAGGRGIETPQDGRSPPRFADTSDPDYQTMLRAIKAGKRLAEETPEADMPGFCGARDVP